MIHIDNQFSKNIPYQLCSTADIGFTPRPGYDFQYWKDSSDNHYQDGQTLVLTSDEFDISAVWKEAYISVFYNTNYSFDYAIGSVNGKTSTYDERELDSGELKFSNSLKEVQYPYSYNINLIDVLSVQYIQDLSNVIKRIPEYSFGECQNIVSVELSDVEFIGECAFKNCKELTSFRVSEGNERYKLLTDSNTTSNSGVALIDTETSSIIFGMIKKASGNIKVPSTISRLGDYAFYNCSSITSIEGENVSSIGDSEFENCFSLKSVDLKSISCATDSSFSVCSSLQSIDLPKAQYLDEYAFLSCLNLKSVNANEVTSVGRSCFDTCSALTDVEMNSLLKVGSYAFIECKSLESIDLPQVSSVGSYAFLSCTELRSASIPNLKNIPTSLFECCLSLDTFILSNAVEDVEFDSSWGRTYVFSKCKTPVSVYLSNDEVIQMFSEDDDWAYLSSNGTVRFVSVEDL